MSSWGVYSWGLPRTFLQQNLELLSGLNERWQCHFYISPWQEALAVWDSTFQEALTVTSTESTYIRSYAVTANSSGKVCVKAVLPTATRSPHPHPPHSETRQQGKCRRETESVTFVLIVLRFTHIPPPAPPPIHAEGQYYKVLGRTSGRPGTWEVCCVLNPHGERNAPLSFFREHGLHQKNTLSIWKEPISTWITFPQGKHRIQDRLQRCQEDRLLFIGFLCMF